MLKFLRKYQKWMLVVFCGALMVAFLIPQAVSQFAPNPAKTVLATTYDGETITREQIVRVSSDVQMLRRLRMEAIPGVSIIPQTGSERNDALAWIMIQRAAERNGLGASQQEAFNLIATVLGLQDFDSLDARAKEMNANANYLIELGRQYLVAEQYRQLVAGVEYSLPEGEDEARSPGLRRVIAMLEANQLIQRLTQNPQQFQIMAMMQNMSPQQYMDSILNEEGFVDAIQGHERFSATELRYALQRQNAQLDLTVVVLDAEDRLDVTDVDEAYVQGIFERFADDRPGAGEPYGVGYREPNKVQLEALRFPIDRAREVVAKQIKPEDVRNYFNENRAFLTEETPEGEEGGPVQATLTMDLRDQIRLTLIEQRAEELVREIAQQARLRLNEDARGLPDDGIFKVLPDDFAPTSLALLASEIETEHGLMPEIIEVNEFVSQQEIIDQSKFTTAWFDQVPKSTIKIMDFDREVYDTTLGGRAALFTSFIEELSSVQSGQLALLSGYIEFVKPFLTDEQIEQLNSALQVGLPGMVLSDASRSTYVFRITKAQPSRPAPELAPIADEVRDDALKIKAYEDLVAEEEDLLKTAAEQSIERLMQDADAKNTLTGLTREMVNQPSAAMVNGLASSQPIIERAFQLADDLIAMGGMDEAKESDLLFAVELAGDYKLAVVRIDTFRPMTLAEYEKQAVEPGSYRLVTSLGMTELPEPPLSFEALQRYTGFKWAEGFGPEEEEDEDADADSEDTES